MPGLLRWDGASLTGPAGVDMVAREWERWVAADPEATLYETPRWAAYRLRELAPNYEGGVLPLCDDAGAAALLPYRFQRSLVGIPTRRWESIGFGGRRADVPLADALRASAAAARNALRLRPYELNLEVPSGLAPPEPPASFRRAELRPLSAKPGTIALGATWDEALQRQGRTFRKHLRQALRKAEASGWELEDLTGRPDEGIALANDLYDHWLNHRHWGAYRGQYRARQRDASLAPVFGGQGLRVFALRRGGDLASVLYGIQFRDGFYLLRQGNNPDFLEASPSITLRGFALRALVEEGVRTLEVVGGTEGYWRTEPPPRVRACFVRRGPGPALGRRLAGAVVARHRARPLLLLRGAIGRVLPDIAGHAA